MASLKRRPWRKLARRLSTALLAAAVCALTCDSVVLLATRKEPFVARDLALQIVLVAAFWWWTSRRSDSLLNAPFVVVFATFFWHSSFLAGRYLHFDPIFEFSGSVLRFGEEFVPLAVALVSLCMVGAVLGTLIGYGQRSHGRSRTSRPAPAAARGTPRVGLPARRYAWALFAGYLALTVAYFSLDSSAAFAGDYLDQYLNASGTLLYRLYQMTKFLGVPAIALVIACVRTRSGFWLACAGVGSLAAVSALTGARTLPFLYCATLVLAVDYFHKPVPLTAVVLFGFGAAGASWVISESRMLGVGVSMLSAQAVGQPISWWHLFWNAGGSVRSVLRTMAFAQQDGPWYGLSFVDALVFVLPGPVVSLLAPGWDVEPPSQWMVRHSPDVGVGEGLGYSLVAEAYLNFGIAGCLLFILVGWLVSYQYFRFRLTGDRFAGAQALTLAALLALHMRSDTVTYLRVLVWGALIIWVCRRLNRSWRQKRNARVTASESVGADDAAAG